MFFTSVGAFCGAARAWNSFLFLISMYPDSPESHLNLGRFAVIPCLELAATVY